MQEDTSIREARESDLPGIVALLADDDLGKDRENSSLPLDVRYTSAFAAIERDENQILIIVEQANAVIGCMQLSFIPGLSRTGMWRGQIESVRIAAAHRGQKVGRLMLDWAINECRLRHCGLVQLTSDKSRLDALQFYEALGFKASHEGLKLDLALMNS